MTKKDDLKRELARRLSTRLNRLVRSSEILDRREAAKLAKLSENHFTNGLTQNMPSYYFADKNQFGPEGLMLFLRSDVERRLSWANQRLDWPPESDEPSTDELVGLMSGEW
jgi:hypothetical protein